MTGRELVAARLAEPDISAIPMAAAEFDEVDTGPLGFTMVGPLMPARRPGHRTCRKCGATVVGGVWLAVARLQSIPVCDGRCEP